MQVFKEEGVHTEAVTSRDELLRMPAKLVVRRSVGAGERPDRAGRLQQQVQQHALLKMLLFFRLLTPVQPARRQATAWRL